MTRTILFLCLPGTLLAAGSDELDAIKKLPSHDKRQERALDLMEASFRHAQDALRENAAPEKIQALLNDTAEAAEYSLAALRETGKKPGKMTKQYKRGDLKTRELMRRFDSFINALPYDDRRAAENIKVRLQVVAEEYLIGVMSKN